MRIALVQHQPTSDHARSVKRGLAACEMVAAEGARLVVFPELSFTPFFPQHRKQEAEGVRSEPIPGPTTEAFMEVAQRLGLVIVINLYEEEGDRRFDTSPVIDADGRLLGRTRMMHITQYEGFYEQDYYHPGDTGIPVYETAIGRLGVAICYDRHYPEYLRALALGGAELVVVPQAGVVGEWPEGMFEAELRAAAFQNGYFMALANRVGREDVLNFGGESFVVDPFGKIVGQAPCGEEAVLIAEVDLAACSKSPARQLFLRHRRPAEYQGAAEASPTVIEH